MAKHLRTSDGQRIAILAGLRTPFSKQSTDLRRMSALDLGTAVVAELLQRSQIPASEIDRIVYGQVVPSLSAPNIAREIIFDAGLPARIDAYSVSRACATSYQAVADLALAIAGGECAAGIAGGADSASDVPIAVSKKLAEALLKLNRARTLADRLKALRDLRPRDLLPQPPALKERSTGLTMGESAEKMAQENRITRAAQDEYALSSHNKAAAAWADGRFAQEVMTVYPPPRYDAPVSADNLVRKAANIDAYAKLRPVFDAKYGTITAGNSSALTDGASAVVLMREDKAKALGFAPLGYVVQFAFTAIDPNGQMLMGPAYAVPKVLDAAGLALKDMALVDVHEAFAAQVLSVTQALESPQFAQRELGKSSAVGAIDWSRFNVMGGSLALGHPFAATGTRQLAQTIFELKRRGGGFGLCTACAAGGLGAALIVEAA